MKKRCVVLYSGGLDSSLTACVMIEQGYDVDLLHMNQGALISNNLFEIRYQEIIETYPNSNITLSDIKIAGDFRNIALASIEQDILEHGVNLVCLGCKLAMHARAIGYCLHNNIKMLADGATKRQDRYGEQRKCAIDRIKGLYREYDIDYVNPVYEYEKNAIKYSAFDRGLTIQSLEDTCIFSKSFTTPTDSMIEAYIDSKVEKFKDIIERRLSYEKNR